MLALLAMGVFAACGEAPPPAPTPHALGIGLALDKSELRAGDTIRLRVIYPKGETATYDLFARLDHRAGPSWVPVYILSFANLERGPLAVPYTPDYPIRSPGLSGREFRPLIMPNVPPGRYRIVKRVNQNDATIELIVVGP